MIRKFPYDPPAIETIPQQLPKKKYTIKIVTPLFGGGVKAGENDTNMLIRPTSIRGHLRFWWRVMHGAKYNSVAEMREAENNIWGSTDTPSKVEVRVEMQSGGTRQVCATFPANRNFPIFTTNFPGYALFPFQGKKANGQVTEQPKEARVGIEFKLWCKCPADLVQEVESTVWAWVNFGGIGARTRRGCGALFCDKLPFQSFSQKIFYRVLLGPNCNDAMIAWNNAVSVYRNFRQQRNPGEGNRPGRSHWTEPDVLRQHANRNDIDPTHTDPINNVKIESFPRVLLGAPIVFHSHQEPGLNSNVNVIHKSLGKTVGDVERVTERMASPVITRPVFYKGEWRAALLILNSPNKIMESIDGVHVDSEERRYPASAIRNDDIRGIKAFEKSSGNADNALDAFVDYAKANGYRNITEVPNER
ncbi:MAG: type III-B CRISPR module RAMP protein Cmr1 [Thermoguttaceae bacterium]